MVNAVRKRDSLYRKEFIEVQRPIVFGSVFIAKPISFQIYTILSALIFLIVITFILVAKYSKREPAYGSVRPIAGLTKVVPSVSGVVYKLGVKEGDHVILGQPVASIKPNYENNLGSVPKQIEARILNDIETETKKTYESKKIIYAENEANKSNFKEIERQIEIGTDQIKLYDESVVLLTKEVDAMNVLKEKGYLAEITLNQKKNQLNQLEIERNATVILLNKLESDAYSLKKTIENFSSRIANEQNVFELNNSKLRQNLSEVRAGIENVVSAPSGGIVSAVYVTESDYISAGKQIISIIPDGNVWVVDLYVTSRAIGGVKVGQVVNLKYDAFPYQQYGIYRGQISTISKSILTADELPRNIPFAEPVYRVIVTIDSQLINYKGQHYDLQAGMSLNAEMITETRTIAGWLLGSLYNLKEATR